MSDEHLRHTIGVYDEMAEAYAARNRRNQWWTEGNPLMPRFQPHVRPGGRVLDVGCGPAHDVVNLRAEGWRVVGVDLSVGMLAYGRKVAGEGLAQADMRRLPFGTGLFDGAWMTASLLHLPRPSAPQALREVRRVLRTGGVLLVSVKEGEGEFLDTRLGERYFTLYTLDELQTRVREAGLKIEQTWRNPGSVQPWVGVVALKPRPR